MTQATRRLKTFHDHLWLPKITREYLLWLMIYVNLTLNDSRWPRIIKSEWHKMSRVDPIWATIQLLEYSKTSRSSSPSAPSPTWCSLLRVPPSISGTKRGIQDFQKNVFFQKMHHFQKNAPFSKNCTIFKKCPIFTGPDLKQARCTGLSVWRARRTKLGPGGPLEF